MQAIARVNRVEEKKDYGYIIDYAGVLGEMDPALKTYSALAEFEAEDLQGVVTQNLEEIEREGPNWALTCSVPNPSYRPESPFGRAVAGMGRFGASLTIRIAKLVVVVGENRQFVALRQRAA